MVVVRGKEWKLLIYIPPGEGGLIYYMGAQHYVTILRYSNLLPRPQSCDLGRSMSQHFNTPSCFGRSHVQKHLRTAASPTVQRKDQKALGI